MELVAKNEAKEESGVKLLGAWASLWHTSLAVKTEECDTESPGNPSASLTSFLRLHTVEPMVVNFVQSLFKVEAGKPNVVFADELLAAGKTAMHSLPQAAGQHIENCHVLHKVLSTNTRLSKDPEAVRICMLTRLHREAACLREWPPAQPAVETLDGHWKSAMDSWLVDSSPVNIEELHKVFTAIHAAFVSEDFSKHEWILGKASGTEEVDDVKSKMQFYQKRWAHAKTNKDTAETLIASLQEKDPVKSTVQSILGEAVFLVNNHEAVAVNISTLALGQLLLTQPHPENFATQVSTMYTYVTKNCTKLKNLPAYVQRLYHDFSGPKKKNDESSSSAQCSTGGADAALAQASASKAEPQTEKGQPVKKRKFEGLSFKKKYVLL